MRGDYINDKILSVIDERDLHCVLNKFCSENLDIRMKTIYHEKSVKNKGKSEWLHPDMVVFQLTTSNWDNNIIEVCKNFYVSKAILYSFELKKAVSLDTLREYYFQAVSNSSWANEGYLVTASLDENNIELISEVKRLVGAFGIGIIKIDIGNPKNSSILFPAKRKDILDGETMNKLYSINPDYRYYIQDITNSLQINKLVATEWDKVEDYEKLKKKIENKLKNISNDSNKLKNDITYNNKCTLDNIKTGSIDATNKETYSSNTYSKVYLNAEKVILTHSIPIKCTINNETYISETWKGLIVNILMKLKDSNTEAFNNYLKISRLFSKTNNFKGTSYHSKLCLFIRPMDSNNCYIELQRFLTSFNIDLSKCILCYEYTDKKK